ncbi:Chloride channel protein [Salmonella enterica subsp. enterica]|uniref:Chloride channel protein n=1 Tax=Salmonella enterica I TaxID=59201 RepID=A0A379WQR7_SALET|nr:Chloride channel protein [Salmonella enterica subsp. enterica]
MSLLHRTEKSSPDSRHWRFYTGILGVIGGPLTLFKGLDEMHKWRLARRWAREIILP